MYLLGMKLAAAVRVAKSTRAKMRNFMAIVVAERVWFLTYVRLVGGFRLRGEEGISVSGAELNFVC